MTDRFRLNPGTVETRLFLAWVEEQLERDQRDWEKDCVSNEKSHYLRGRMPAWRMPQALAEPPREVKIDGKAA